MRRRSRLQQLRELYVFRCGYCGVSERDTGALLTQDHFQPRVHAGPTTLANLVYACHTCNTFKGDWWNPTDENRILHPLNDPIEEHLTEEDSGSLRPLTQTGRFHIERLHLNRPPLVLHRRELRARERLARREAEVLSRLDALEAQADIVEREIRRLSS